MKIRIFFFLWWLLISRAEFRSVMDDANLLNPSSIKEIERMAGALRNSVGVWFLFQTREVDSLDHFEEDCTRMFEEWIRMVPDSKGILLYFEVEKGVGRGKVNFSSGYGLRGVLGREHVQEVLREKILAFRDDPSQQKPLLEGIRIWFEKIENFFVAGNVVSDQESVQNGDKTRVLILVVILFASMFLVALGIVYMNSRCPRCGSRLHVRIRPLYTPDEQYRRMKILKCLECNYFKKYLF